MGTDEVSMVSDMMQHDLGERWLIINQRSQFLNWWYYSPFVTGSGPMGRNGAGPLEFTGIPGVLA